MTQDLLEILVDIFKSSGYNVTISSQCDILVEKNGHEAYVRCALQPDYKEIAAFYEEVRDYTGIYVTTQKISGELTDYAAELGIYVWDRDELALQIGRVVLANMEQQTSDYCFESESTRISDEESFRNVASEYPIENWKVEEEEFDKESYFNEEPHSFKALQERTRKESFEVASLPWTYSKKTGLKSVEQCNSELNSYETLNIQSVEPKISKDQAIVIAKPYLSNPNDATLKFVPFWRYRYNVEAEKKFRSKILSIVGEGKGFLNALNKSREEIDIEGFSTPTRIPAVQYDVKRPNVDKKQAEEILLDFIIQKNTREMCFNNLEGQAIIYEQRSIKPKPNEVDLKMELVYIPVWEVKGKRNSLEINAYDAKVLEKPIDEDAEFV